MNMISQLRQRVRQNGQVTITAEEYDLLQTEWITRIGAEDMVEAEREACAKVCADRAHDEPGKLPTPDAYKDEAMMCAAYIRARSNVI